MPQRVPASVLKLLPVFVLGLHSITVSAQAQPLSTNNGEWPSYGGDLRNHHYSPLDQINASNFSKLVVAWRFKADSLGPRPEYKLEGTPLMVKGVVYATAGRPRASCSGYIVNMRANAERLRPASCRDVGCPTGPTARATTAFSM